MNKKVLTSKPLHRIPKDLSLILQSNTDVLHLWNKLTPLARNEWICWITIVKKTETRKKHLVQFSDQIIKGKKRPCCWPGCPHRRESAQKWFGKKK